VIEDTAGVEIVLVSRSKQTTKKVGFDPLLAIYYSKKLEDQLNLLVCL
jgi:hypothetical protein